MHVRRLLAWGTVASVVGVLAGGCGSTTELPLDFENKEQLDGGGMGGGGNEASIPDISIGDGNQNKGDSQSDAPRSTGACKPRTCAGVGANCGPVGDGCGGLVQCGTCNAPDSCGGGGHASQCGHGGGCVPKTCADVGATCGPIGDGCGGIVDCDVCPIADAGADAADASSNATCGCASPQTCGGGGVPSKCGGSQGCVPLTCGQQNITCGKTGDGCGNVIDCGDCGSGESCGAVTPSKCGASGGADGGGSCQPKTCADFGVDCGPAGDGCGGLLDCGSCSGAQTCGGGGVPSKCGGSAGCIPRTCAQVGVNCGPIGDGCGNVLQCGTCTRPANVRRRRHAERVRRHELRASHLRASERQLRPGRRRLRQFDSLRQLHRPDICGGGGVRQPVRRRHRARRGSLHRPLPAAGDLRRRRHDEHQRHRVRADAGTYLVPGTPRPALQRARLRAQRPAAVVAFARASRATMRRGPSGLAARAARSPAPTASSRSRTCRSAPTSRSSSSSAAGAGRSRSPTVVACAGHRAHRAISRACRAARPRARTSRSWPSSTGTVDALECVLRKIGIDDTEFTDPAAPGACTLYQDNGAGTSTDNNHSARGLRRARRR